MNWTVRVRGLGLHDRTFARRGLRHMVYRFPLIITHYRLRKYLVGSKCSGTCKAVS